MNTSTMMQSNQRMNFMASGYQADAMQYRSKPFAVRVDSTSGSLFVDDDCFPLQQRPRPMFSAPGESQFFDGDISITPDKRSFIQRDNITDNIARCTVTFDENINVQELSPQSSLCMGNSSNDTHDSSITNSSTSSSQNYFPSETSDTYSDDTIETVDIVADDYYVPNLTNHIESKLARPEFSSIISISKEKTKIEEEDLDLSHAVKEKLTVSKTKTKMDERAYKHLNREEQQFQHLHGTDVDENAISQAEKFLSTRVKSRRNNGKKTVEPDIMEFFHDSMQKESGSYSIKTFSEADISPSIVDEKSAFDVYNYVLSWDNV